MRELVIATRNPGKQRELELYLAGLDLECLALDRFPDAPAAVEDGDTFLANAQIKARALARYANRYALADDSGIKVAALAGAPGVFSARYAGPSATDERNNRKLLAELNRIPGASRAARFICVLCVASPRGRTLVAEGACEGLILEAPRGTLGFGYDPLFYSPELKAAFGEVSPAEKLKVSHRGRALRELRRLIEAGELTRI